MTAPTATTSRRSIGGALSALQCTAPAVLTIALCRCTSRVRYKAVQRSARMIAEVATAGDERRSVRRLTAVGLCSTSQRQSRAAELS